MKRKAIPRLARAARKRRPRRGKDGAHVIRRFLDVLADLGAARSGAAKSVPDIPSPRS